MERAPSRVKRQPAADGPYERILSIDGSHPFKDAVPCGYVEYKVRTRRDGKVLYFNFALAKEMGLIPADHPNRLTKRLTEVLLETFCIQIINEYDLMNDVPIRPRDIKPNSYMATRYLQLQHPGRQGITSGDGRSIWNGYFEGGGKTWDISSCGTGATCLSPAVAKQKIFFRTGDPRVSYGCGESDLTDGLTSAILSEIFHQNDIPTERSLLVIELPRSRSINVRAAPNLLRPSHFFNHLKQGQLQRLRPAVDLFIERQMKNRVWAKPTPSENLYDYLLKHVTETFARITAQFESEYIFCWLDWDGDNILADGGIIDYGSVRQFGLYHHQYRYDDTDRWSTTIPEQRSKARYIVQTFAQMVDFLKTGKKRNVRDFSRHRCLKDFDRQFELLRQRFLLGRMGFSKTQAELLVQHQRPLIKRFAKAFGYFEKAKSRRGYIRLPDGITWNAIYCMRDILRQLPHHLLHTYEPMAPKRFLETMKSSYASKRDTRPTPARVTHIHQFQTSYMALIERLAHLEKRPISSVVKGLSQRSEAINRLHRTTGDAVINVGDTVMRARNRITSEQFHRILSGFISAQQCKPAERDDPKHGLDPSSQRIVRSMLRIVASHKDSI